MKKLFSILSFLTIAISLSAQSADSFLRINGSEDGFFADLACRDTLITVNVDSSDDYSVTTTSSWCVVENKTRTSFDLVIGYNDSGKQRDCIIRVSNSERMAPIALSQMSAPFLRVNHRTGAMTYGVEADPVTVLLDIESSSEYTVVSPEAWIRAVKTESGCELVIDPGMKKSREGTVIVASGDLQIPVTIIQKAVSKKSPSLFVKLASLIVFCGWGVFAVVAP